MGNQSLQYVKRLFTKILLLYPLWNQTVTDASLITQIKEVIDYLRLREHSLTKSDLMYGSTGTAIFNYYIYKSNGSISYLDRCITYAQYAIDSLTANEIKNLYLGKGVSGVLWGLIHLSELGAFDFDVEEVVDEADGSTLTTDCLLPAF